MVQATSENPMGPSTQRDDLRVEAVEQKTTVSAHLTPVRMATIKKTNEKQPPKTKSQLLVRMCRSWNPVCC